MTPSTSQDSTSVEAKPKPLLFSLLICHFFTMANFFLLLKLPEGVPVWKVIAVSISLCIFAAFSFLVGRQMRSLSNQSGKH